MTTTAPTAARFDAFEHFRRAAAEAGYEVAHGSESCGEHFFGLFILVKMSNRKLVSGSSLDDLTQPYDYLGREADAIRKNIETVSAKLDPEGPAERARCLQEIADIYRDAGAGAIYVEPLPNGYCQDPCCLNRPWARVTSSIGHVVIGWRKRVISIDWKDSTIKASGEELFPGENVTRWEAGIHAYGAKKAAEYVNRLHSTEVCA